METRSKYEKEIASRIRDKEMDCTDVNSRVRVLNEIMKELVEAVIPFTEQPKKKWITEKL